MRVSLCQVFVCACASMNVSIHTPIPPTSHPVCKRWGHLRSSAGGECVSTVGSCVCGGRRFWAGRGSVPAICFEPHGAGAAERSSSPGLIPLRTMLSPLPLLSPSISHSSNLLTHLLLTLLLAERSRSIRARTHRRIRTRTRTRAHAHTLTHTHTQFADLLRSIGFLPRNDRAAVGSAGGGKGGREEMDESANGNSGSSPIVCAVVCAGLYPNIARVERVGGGRGGGGGDIVLRGQAGETREFVLHKNSVLHQRSVAVPPGALVRGRVCVDVCERANSVCYACCVCVCMCVCVCARARADASDRGGSRTGPREGPARCVGEGVSVRGLVLAPHSINPVL